jgi:hypothetical protein
MDSTGEKSQRKISGDVQTCQRRTNRQGRAHSLSSPETPPLLVAGSLLCRPEGKAPGPSDWEQLHIVYTLFGECDRLVVGERWVADAEREGDQEDAHSSTRTTQYALDMLVGFDSSVASWSTDWVVWQKAEGIAIPPLGVWETKSLFEFSR